MPSQEEEQQQILVFLPPKCLRSLSRKHGRDEGDLEQDGDGLTGRRLQYRRLDLASRDSNTLARGRDSLEQEDRSLDHGGNSSYAEQGEETAEMTGGRGTTQEGTSLAPPPSFHFALNRVTSVSEILAHPSRFIKTDTDVRPKVNLLVLVREVGPLERYEPKYRQNNHATSSRWVPPASGYRSHLVVYDRDGSLLKLTLWDRCARAWAGEEEEHEQEQEQRQDGGQSRAGRSKMYDTTTQLGPSRAAVASGSEKSTSMGTGGAGLEDSVPTLADESTSSSLGAPPRALRAGDVVYLTKLLLNPPRDSTTNATRMKRSRISNTSSTAIQVSTSNESDVQLCFRSEIRVRRDEAYAYIGPDRVVGSELRYLAEFDAHCRAVWQLVRRWL